MMKWNQYLFAGLVYSVQSGLIIGSLYGLITVVTMLAFTQSVDGSALFFFIAIPSAIAFVASYWSFMSFMILRSIRGGHRPEIEAWLIPGGAALMINLFFILETEDPNFWVVHITNGIVSAVGVILCRKRCKKTQEKLNSLISSNSENPSNLKA